MDLTIFDGGKKPQLMPLNFEGHEIRIVYRDGEPWWVLADVCRVLEIENPRNVAARLDEDEKAVHVLDTPGGPQEMTVIGEPGLYKLIQTSRKPDAQRDPFAVRCEPATRVGMSGHVMR